MSCYLNVCKKITKRIEKNQVKCESTMDQYNQLVTIVEKDTESLNKMLKKLTAKERVQYGYQMGFIEKKGYSVMMEQLKRKEKKNST